MLYLRSKLRRMGYNFDKVIQEALEEDIVDYEGKLPGGDHTSLACIPYAKLGRAQLLCKAEGVLAGLSLAQKIFKAVDASITMETLLTDGARIKKGDVAFRVEGEVKALLRAERVVLNFMQRMSGIATNTARYVQKVEGTKAKVLDTRKTTPLLRYFEKEAVRIGGGQNHRYGLYDMILIKDNHIDFCGGVKAALDAVKNYQQQNNLKLPVEIETRTTQDIEDALAHGHLTRIMFDNFTPERMTEAVKLVNGRYETEASGGITLDTIRAFAETGVDFISVGALTHSSVSLDLSLKAY